MSQDYKINTLIYWAIFLAITVALYYVLTLLLSFGWAYLRMGLNILNTQKLYQFALFIKYAPTIIASAIAYSITVNKLIIPKLVKMNKNLPNNTIKADEN